MKFQLSLISYLSTVAASTKPSSDEKCYQLVDPQAPIRDLETTLFTNIEFDDLVARIHPILNYFPESENYDTCLASYHGETVEDMVSLFQPDEACFDTSPQGIVFCLLEFLPLFMDLIAENAHGCCQGAYDDVLTESFATIVKRNAFGKKMIESESFATTMVNSVSNTTLATILNKSLGTTLDDDLCYLLEDPNAPIRNLQYLFPYQNFDSMLAQIGLTLEYFAQSYAYEECLASYNGNNLLDYHIVALFKPEGVCHDDTPGGILVCLAKFLPLVADLAGENYKGCCQGVLADVMTEHGAELITEHLARVVVLQSNASDGNCSLLTDPEAPIRDILPLFPTLKFDELVSELEPILSILPPQYEQCIASYNGTTVVDIVTLVQPDGDCSMPDGLDLTKLLSCLTVMYPLVNQLAKSNANGCCVGVFNAKNISTP